MSENRFCFNAVRSQGLRHIEEGLPCQDAATYRSRETEDGSFVNAVVLSDGCSSSGLSHFGSDLTVNVTADFLVSRFDDLLNMSRLEASKAIITNVIDAEKKYIGEHAEEFSAYYAEHVDEFDEYVRLRGSLAQRMDPDDLLTCFFLSTLNATLLFAVMKDERWIMGQIGDGYIFRLTEEGAMEIAMMEDKDGEHNSTDYPQSAYFECVALGDETAYARHLRLARGEKPMSAWVLISDGPENTLVEKAGRYQRVRTYVWDVMLRCTKLETPEKANEILQEFFDRKVRPSTKIHGGDDISVALMVAKDAELDHYVDKDLDEGKPIEQPVPVESLVLLEQPDNPDEVGIRAEEAEDGSKLSGDDAPASEEPKESEEEEAPQEEKQTEETKPSGEEAQAVEAQKEAETKNESPEDSQAEEPKRRRNREVVLEKLSKIGGLFAPKKKPSPEQETVHEPEPTPEPEPKPLLTKEEITLWGLCLLYYRQGYRLAWALYALPGTQMSDLVPLFGHLKELGRIIDDPAVGPAGQSFRVSEPYVEMRADIWTKLKNMPKDSEGKRLVSKEWIAKEMARALPSIVPEDVEALIEGFLKQGYLTVAGEDCFSFKNPKEKD